MKTRYHATNGRCPSKREERFADLIPTLQIALQPPVVGPVSAAEAGPPAYASIIPHVDGNAGGI